MSGSRAHRRDYLQLNDGSDEVGYSDNFQPPRSRRRIDPTPGIILNEPVLQFHLSIQILAVLFLDQALRAGPIGSSLKILGYGNTFMS